MHWGKARHTAHPGIARAAASQLPAPTSTRVIPAHLSRISQYVTSATSAEAAPTNTATRMTTCGGQEGRREGGSGQASLAGAAGSRPRLGQGPAPHTHTHTIPPLGLAGRCKHAAAAS